jgi:hypothetical protein
VRPSSARKRPAAAVFRRDQRVRARSRAVARTHAFKHIVGGPGQPVPDVSAVYAVVDARTGTQMPSMPSSAKEAHQVLVPGAWCLVPGACSDAATPGRAGSVRPPALDSFPALDAALMLGCHHAVGVVVDMPSSTAPPAASSGDEEASSVRDERRMVAYLEAREAWRRSQGPERVRAWCAMVRRFLALTEPQRARLTDGDEAGRLGA